MISVDAVRVTAVSVISLIHLNPPVVVRVLLYSVGANPFDEDDDDEADFSNVVGIPVEALYDYVGQEEDELSFSKGITVQNSKVQLHYSLFSFEDFCSLARCSLWVCQLLRVSLAVSTFNT